MTAAAPDSTPSAPSAPSAPSGRLAARGVHIGPYSLGCAQLGNLYREMSDETATEIVNAAWEGGIRHFDTAPHYGLGLSEDRLGRTLRGRPRDEVVVSTKVGRLLEPNPTFTGEVDAQGFVVPARLIRRWDFSADGVRRSIEGSLTRLGLDRIDLALVHDPEENTADPDQGLREAIPALAELRREGVIRAIGIGTKSISSLLRFAENADVDAVMIAGRYTLLNQEALAELLPACAERSIDVLNAGVFNSGILASPRPPEEAVFDYGPAGRSLIDRVTRMAELCDRFGTSIPRLALQFAASHPSIRSVVFGADSAAQVVSNLELAASPTAQSALWEELAAADLLPVDAARLATA